jgi:hypothetical protein
MASAYLSIPKSFDVSPTYRECGEPLRIEVQKDGRNVGYKRKRIGAHRPKKLRNR